MDSIQLPNLRQLAALLELGKTTSRELVERCLDRIADSSGEGERAFLSFSTNARVIADRIDRQRKDGRAPTPFAGVPISLKDLFDIEGEVTRAGSVVLNDAVPAAQDAPVVARLRAAGFVLIGRTNMTEFAYSGLGLNPHYGTPKNPFDRNTGRIPGGSSSGAAVSVTDGMAAAGLGTDTGGSCRIPAALTGIVGFKATAAAISREGMVPLSTSLDSVGWLSGSVASCAVLNSVFSGGSCLQPQSPAPLKGLRLLAPTTLVLDEMDQHVGAAFDRALRALSDAGATIVVTDVPEIEQVPLINSKGGFAAAEAYAWHRGLLASMGDRYDPRVRVRIEKGSLQTAADYIDLHRGRGELIAAFSGRYGDYDAIVMPTVPRIAPTFAELENDDEYGRINLQMLRNPTIVNMLDGCAVSVPCHRPGEPPVGLTVAGLANQDSRILAIAQMIEAHISPIGIPIGRMR